VPIVAAATMMRPGTADVHAEARRLLVAEAEDVEHAR